MEINSNYFSDTIRAAIRWLVPLIDQSFYDPFYASLPYIIKHFQVQVDIQASVQLNNEHHDFNSQ